MQLKGAKKDVRTIGRDLGVRYVLEGGVRKAGNSLRITAQLIDALTDAHLWADKYSGTIDDVFEVQERVSREIVRALDVTLTTDEHRRLAERPIASVRAFELYLQARREVRRLGGDALERASRLLSQAVAIEGETPPLLALMAWVTVTQVKAGINRDLTAVRGNSREGARAGGGVPQERERTCRGVADRRDALIGRTLARYRLLPRVPRRRSRASLTRRDLQQAAWTYVHN